MAEVMKQVTAHCPDLETIAAYLDGRLSDRERARVTEHLADCETCYSVMTEAVQTASVPALTSETSSDRPNHQWWRSKPVVWSSSVAGALATAATVWLAVGGSWFTASPDSAALRALVAAVGNERPVEARLTGGFAYGPLRSAVRSGDGSTVPLSPDVRIAAARIEKEALTHRTPQMLRSLGSAYLVMGDVDRAVPVLEEAIDAPTPDARALSDMAAAYLARATRGDHPEDLARALSMADRALKAEPRLPEASFNRAYALQRLSLLDQARQAWQDFLKIDSSSGWATEARSRVRALEMAPPSSLIDDEKKQIGDAVKTGRAGRVHDLVGRSPAAAREWLQDELLSTWPRAIQEGHPVEADSILARLRPAADALAESTGDRFMIDAVVAAVSASRDGAPAHALARAHDEFRLATDDYGNDRIPEAIHGFESALAQLQRAKSPFGVWTQIFLSVGRYYAADFTGSLRLLDPVVRAARERGYVRVLGLAHRMRGLVHGVQGDFGGAVEEYRLAVVQLDQTRGAEDQASMHALTGEMLGFLGETDLAWSEFLKASGGLPMVRNPRDRQMILQLTSLAALRDGLPQAASYYQQAALVNAEQWGRSRAILDARLYQGEIYRQTGNDNLALAELAAARKTLSTIGDPSMVARNEAQILLAQGEIEGRTNPVEASRALSKALAFFQQTHRDWPVARVLLARSRAYLAQGRQDLAEADLAAGIDVFEHRRASVADEALRSVSFEQPWDLHSEMIRLQGVSRGQPDRALSLAERARARTLVEALASGNGATTVDPSTAFAVLPPSTTVVYYASLDDRLLIWTLTNARRTFADTPVRRAELDHLVRQYRSEMEAGFADGRDMPSLARLYDVLLAPVESALDGRSELVFVPDGSLHSVPFAALVRRDDRRYLIERQAVLVTPSLTLFLAASSRVSTPAPSRGALVFGNPQIESSDLPDLPEAEAEAREIAALSDGSELFIGLQATKLAFLSAAGKHTVVHFAGHAIANENRPDLSRLIMAGPDEATRSLFARDIAKESFPATALVVLGACRTNSGRIRRGEGVFTIARPFLAAGVPSVIASLWDVNDRASRRLLVAFHRALRQPGSVAAALRAAQLELLMDADPRLQQPSSWSGFTVVGGQTFFGMRRPPAGH